jgi:hypothetical protein
VKGFRSAQAAEAMIKVAAALYGNSATAVLAALFRFEENSGRVAGAP